MLKKIIIAVGLFACSVTVVFAQSGATVATVANSLTGQVQSALGFLVWLAPEMFAIFLAYKSVMKFKEYGESKGGQQGGGLLAPIAMLMAAVFFASLPLFVRMGQNILFYGKHHNSSSNKTEVEKSNY